MRRLYAVLPILCVYVFLQSASRFERFHSLFLAATWETSHTHNAPHFKNAMPPTDTIDLYADVDNDTAIAGNPVHFRVKYGNNSTKTANSVTLYFIKSS